MEPARLLLLDSATLYYRAFHALPTSLTDPNERPNNAVRGFCDGLLTLVKAAGATDLICAWDEDWRPQWRVDLWPGYKTHRVEVEPSTAAKNVDGASSEGPSVEAVPDELSAQVDTIAAILDAAGIPRVGAEGFEADDVIATIATGCSGAVVIATSDRDLLQCVTPDSRVQVLSMARGLGSLALLGAQEVRDAYAVEPEQYADFATLRGDPSDGLPGVRGIGAKTAATFLQRYGDLTGILRAAADPAQPITPRVRASLFESAEVLPAWRAVTAARTDVPVTDYQAALPRPSESDLDNIAAEAGVARQIESWRGTIIR